MYRCEFLQARLWKFFATALVRPDANVEWKDPMRIGLVLLWTLLCSITSALAQVSVGIGLPGVSIGINLPVYPSLVTIPGYPVYYAPQMNSNYFFYDGMYWVYQDDNWYASSWYNGPWALVGPEAVPLFVLRVPVRYYRRPPSYFHGWRTDASPRWGEHWGNTWEQNHSGWDNWNRSSVPAPAPLPIYQRQYSGSRYPQAQQQQALQSQNYHYQPRDAVVQQHYQAQPAASVPVAAPQARQVPREARPPQPDQRVSARPPALQQATQPAPIAQPSHAAAVREPQAARVQSQDKAVQAKVLTPQSPPAAASPQQQILKAQAKPPAPQPTAQQKSPPPQVVAHSQPLPPKAQAQDNAPQGKGPAPEAKKSQDKGEGKAEQQGGEHNK